MIFAMNRIVGIGIHLKALRRMCRHSGISRMNLEELILSLRSFGSIWSNQTFPSNLDNRPRLDESTLIHSNTARKMRRLSNVFNSSCTVFHNLWNTVEFQLEQLPSYQYWRCPWITSDFCLSAKVLSGSIKFISDSSLLNAIFGFNEAVPLASLIDALLSEESLELVMGTPDVSDFESILLELNSVSFLWVPDLTFDLPILLLC